MTLAAALAVGYSARGIEHAHQPGRPSSSPTGSSSGSSAGSSGAVALSTLPPQVAATVRLIDNGGPFPYPRSDGVVFHNDEHHLPKRADGFYREYTVPTPGSPDRGARRIVTGAPGEYWYTPDHYATFVRVDVTQ